MLRPVHLLSILQWPLIVLPVASAPAYPCSALRNIVIAPMHTVPTPTGKDKWPVKAKEADLPKLVDAAKASEDAIARLASERAAAASASPSPLPAPEEGSKAPYPCGNSLYLPPSCTTECQVSRRRMAHGAGAWQRQQRSAAVPRHMLLLNPGCGAGLLLSSCNFAVSDAELLQVCGV